ncbi:4Fe-4S binding protein [Sedimenticola selenatireducens]|uniref:4Fe-4S binding protein n=1 Tax=Sedimenticola selenatireducens TaxID=191960 RepID=UPI002AAB1BBE|nr:4Fe-4S binding protein [Sedimenticola selenatireducens]
MSEQITDTIRVRNERARAAALAALAGVKVEATDLIEFQSRGRVVIIGGNEALEFASRLQPPLRAQVLLTEGEELPGVPVIPQAGRTLRIDGHLGAFRLQLGEPGKPNAELLTADLILDLETEPQLDMPMKPPGYLCSGTDEPSLEQAAEQLRDLVGTFDKPRYFNYDASICAHGRSGQIACTRCIDACPAEAISSLIEKVTVDVHRCQGGGVCATVCPSGAIRYSYPQPRDTLEQVRLLLKTYRQAGGLNPVLVISADTDGAPPPLEPHLIPLEVEELASVGLETWLSALAYGAESVLLLDRGAMPERVGEAVKQQIGSAGEILAALGYPDSAVRLVDEQSLSADVENAQVAITPANFSANGGKRQVAYMAIDHLFEQSTRARPMVNLTVGAPFGTAQVEADACTLCLACVGACPGRALLAGEDEPQLRFIEANCLQCGICTRTCPEDAIWITPRLLFDREERNRIRLLHREPPFCCSECGKPFATRSVIENMLKKLEGHWMFQDSKARHRLTLCEDCRVVDIVQDPQAMAQGVKGETLQ